MKLLDPFELDLSGSTLIEASAGTGKTYTITTLFLRLLLEKQVSIDKILIVTFTIAATDELRIKLGDRLNLAYHWLKQPDAVDPERDDTLARLVTEHRSAQSIRLLGDAVARLEDLSVFTIDALCLRVLEEFSFETGMPMRVELLPDDSEVRMQTAEDYWRTVMGSGDQFEMHSLLSLAKSPTALLNVLQSLLRFRELDVLPPYDIDEVRRLSDETQRQYQNIITGWRNHSSRIKEILKDEANLLKKASYSERGVEAALSLIKELESSEQLPSSLHERFKLFTQDWLTKQTKKGLQPPTHPFFTTCNGFAERFQRVTKLRKVAAVEKALTYLQENIALYKRNNGLLHFEDMRTRLDLALQQPEGETLASLIRELWPYAMIDEFQDTDAEQYRIFNTIYAPASKPDSNSEDTAQCGFFMIGDPKQAIYGFRGADIFSYLSAVERSSTVRTLGTNYRSVPTLVNAVNQVFSQQESAFVLEQIQFHPVDANASNDSQALTIGSEPVQPLQFRCHEFSSDAGVVHKDFIALACASEIADLLSTGLTGEAAIDNKPVVPADIAVLVRSHSESRKMQQALREYGVRSVSMPVHSVFRTAEASELLRLLECMAFPKREDKIRAALVTNMLGFDSRAMEQLLEDEQQWDAIVSEFIKAHDMWSEGSFIVALQHMLLEMNVNNKLMRLTVQSRKVTSHEELILWLQKMLSLDNSADDSLLLRLESDEGLVQIVTMHKSKGLEYPIVFMPFPWSIRPIASDGTVIFHDRETHRKVVDFGSEQSKENGELQKQEVRSEDLRLLYVALTRAKSYCVLYWGNEFRLAHSALSYLLHGEPSRNGLEYDAIRADLNQLAANADGNIVVTDAIRLDSTYRDSKNSSELKLPVFDQYINRRWRLNSYTGLLRGKDADLPDHDAMTVVDELDDTVVDDVKSDETERLISSLPAGARTGQVLHDIFEYMDFTDTDNLDELIQQSLTRHGGLQSTVADKNTDWTPIISMIVKNTIQSNLVAETSLSLDSIDMQNKLSELEFFFSVGALSPDALQNVLSNTDAYADIATGLNFPAFEGLMQGFIDVVVRHKNKYYIVDYKSNWLGETTEDYSQRQLEQAMTSHRYQLQYIIYTVALHRYLKMRDPDYQYDTHFGGALYLFIRGMRANADTGVWFDRPPLSVIDALDKLMQPDDVVA